MSEIKYRWAPSLGGGFSGTAKTAWGIDEWDGKEECPVVFCGLYGLADFYALWRHKSKKYIWWCGSDVTHFVNGYWLDDNGDIRIDPTPLAQWIDKNCESWCENDVEKKALAEVGITAQVCPSFLGNVDDYDIEFVTNERPEVYMSVSSNNFQLYGWDILEEIADKCDVDFHLYGNTEPWNTKHSNVFVHGRVPLEQMNAEIKKMQCGLRLCVEMDGFSEVTAKSVLWGQYPIVAESYGYPHLLSFRNTNDLVHKLNRLRYLTKPNPARDIYKILVNSYPWKNI